MKKTDFCAFALFICLDVSMLLSFNVLGGGGPGELTGRWQKGNFPGADFLPSMAAPPSGPTVAAPFAYRAVGRPNFSPACQASTARAVRTP